MQFTRFRTAISDSQASNICKWCTENDILKILYEHWTVWSKTFRLKLNTDSRKLHIGRPAFGSEYISLNVRFLWQDGNEK